MIVDNESVYTNIGRWSRIYLISIETWNSCPILIYQVSHRVRILLLELQIETMVTRYLANTEHGSFEPLPLEFCQKTEIESDELWQINLGQLCFWVRLSLKEKIGRN